MKVAPHIFNLEQETISVQIDNIHTKSGNAH
jgi:hypothetical protein